MQLLQFVCCVQAKEWAPDRVVGQPDIQSFVGAIAGKHGDGLFVTTAKFSQKAKDYANTHHIILIDGERLANLMIEYNFCVSTRKTFEIKAIDTDALAEYQDQHPAHSQHTCCTHSADTPEPYSSTPRSIYVHCSDASVLSTDPTLPP